MHIFVCVWVSRQSPCWLWKEDSYAVHSPNLPLSWPLFAIWTTTITKQTSAKAFSPNLARVSLHGSPLSQPPVCSLWKKHSSHILAEANRIHLPTRVSSVPMCRTLVPEQSTAKQSCLCRKNRVSSCWVVSGSWVCFLTTHKIRKSTKDLRRPLQELCREIKIILVY